MKIRNHFVVGFVDQLSINTHIHQTCLNHNEHIINSAMEATVNPKKALVTGASSGIGCVFARDLANENYFVTGVARNAEKLTHIFKELGNGHQFIPADLTQPVQLAKIEKELSETKYLTFIVNRLLSRKKIIEIMGNSNPALI